MKKALEWIGNHKKEILIGAGVTVAAVAGVVLAKRIPVWVKFPYKVSMRVPHKETADALKVFLFGPNGQGQTIDGGKMLIHVRAERLDEMMKEVVTGENAERIYSAMVLKLPIAT